MPFETLDQAPRRIAVIGGGHFGDGGAQGLEWELFDDVVLETHSDISLELLAHSTPAGPGALAAIRYQPNQTVPHSDPSLMPKSWKVWSSCPVSSRRQGRESGST